LENVGGASLLLTNARGDETRCTREALEQGATTIVVLGGDGTVSQVACELVRQQSKVPLAVFGAGTGNDFAKSLTAPIHNFVAMSQLIANAHTIAIDAGRVDDSVFVNSAGFGFDAAVVALTNHPGARTGKFMYVLTALQQLCRYGGFDARIFAGTNNSPHGQPAISRKSTVRWLTLVFANGGYFGGAFRIAPEAAVSDGLLDAVFVRNASSWRRISVFGRALSGAHTGQPEVEIHRNSSWTLEFSAPPVYQVDGELRQAASTTVIVSVFPDALRIVSPEPH
ncbi:MAG: diacylglycerol kinase family protein, partial [Gemmatimonadaceae bacterium]